MSKTLLVCDCLVSQNVDAAALQVATGLPCAMCYSSLCTDQIDIAAKAIAQGDVVIACQQEAHRFVALAEEMDASAPDFVDIRDRAGWTDDAGDTTPKMAALIADAALIPPSQKSFDIITEGTCLIVGATEVALSAAEKLGEALSVTVLLAPGAEIIPTQSYDAVVGNLHQATGTLGRFEVRINEFQQSVSGGRGTPAIDPGAGWCFVSLRYHS